MVAGFIRVSCPAHGANLWKGGLAPTPVFVNKRRKLREAWRLPVDAGEGPCSWRAQVVGPRKVLSVPHTGRPGTLPWDRMLLASCLPQRLDPIVAIYPWCKDFPVLPSKTTKASHQFQALAEGASVNTDHVALTLCMESAALVKVQAAPRGCGAPFAGTIPKGTSSFPPDRFGSPADQLNIAEGGTASR